MNIFGTVGEDGTITHPEICANTGEPLRRNIGYKRINLPSHPNAFVGVQPGIRIRLDRLAELDAEYAASLPTPSPDETPELVATEDTPATVEKPTGRGNTGRSNSGRGNTGRSNNKG